jgi:hypothetical protein
MNFLGLVTRPDSLKRGFMSHVGGWQFTVPHGGAMDLPEEYIKDFLYSRS